MNILKWFDSMFRDEQGSVSSKRVVGVICSLALVVALFVDIPAPTYLVDAVVIIAVGGLGLTSVDKIFKKANPKE